ncbi:hypothetical protein Clacol_007215 [Clathrus columnatus]|uniref:Protein regulator of cytokinesis 1 n=1 Tax=Clathrus columnatus TaxID=1419009 RepID=A0AAV5AIL8_9AGAM|nr:hypothetical protein Clacol_007215 [Clathrus columnatus]
MATTVESLLTSLQTYLTAQTPIIPALHAQLGLPPTALTDELAELHNALIECVDKKIDGRRKEVEDWMNKCERVEIDCIRLSKALGSHAKTLANSVGELRKQQILPKRFDYLNVYQEKLQQLYQTKYEQGMGLTNKINALVHILGNNFFPPDIVSTISAPGTTEESPKALKDVSPERFNKLEKELVRAKGEITRRRIHLSQTFLHIGWLHEELGLTLPAESEMIAFPRSISGSSTLSTSDLFMTSTRSSSGFTTTTTNSVIKPPEDELQSYNAVFGRFVSRLQEASDESLDLEGPGNEAFGVEDVEPTIGLMKWVEGLRHDLEELKARRENQIQGLYNELDALWRRLGVSEADMDAFIEANRGSTEANVQAYECEYERMLELKRESMSIFVANARAEIERLWDELILGEEERGAFAPFTDGSILFGKRKQRFLLMFKPDEHTEELLTLHEKEIQKLKEERRIKAPLLASLKKYFEICEEEKELATAAADQSRLLGRGPRDPGRLLREEKMRKRVTKEKPRLEKELFLAIPAWENEYRRPFLVNGMNVLDVLSDTLTSEMEKENRKRTRPGSVPARGTTPQPTGRTTPAPSGYMSAEKPSANKRARLGNSTNQNPGYPYGRSSPTKSTAGSISYPAYGGGKLGKTTPTAVSSLPRAVSNSNPRHGHGGNGHGNHHHDMSTTFGLPRIASNTSVGNMSMSSLFNKRPGGGSRRESFKPRPSADGIENSSTVTGNTRPWAQFMTRVQEEIV